MAVAVITGASRGLGRALAQELSERGWKLVLDGRSREPLEAVAAETGGVAVAGDVSDPAHRQALHQAAESLGGADALVNNASVLGPSPQPAMSSYPIDVLEQVYRVNVIAPIALTQLFLPGLRERGGRVVNVTSDAGVEPYEGWGGYGSSKAALEHATKVLALEEPTVQIYTVDPGDMNTVMHQEAFPGEDISDRPPPEVSVPGLVALLEGDRASGRYIAREVA